MTRHNDNGRHACAFRAVPAISPERKSIYVIYFSYFRRLCRNTFSVRLSTSSQQRSDSALTAPPSSPTSASLASNCSFGVEEGASEGRPPVGASLHSGEKASRYWRVYLEMGLWLSTPWLHCRATLCSFRLTVCRPMGGPGEPEEGRNHEDHETDTDVNS